MASVTTFLVEVNAAPDGLFDLPGADPAAARRTVRQWAPGARPHQWLAVDGWFATLLTVTIVFVACALWWRRRRTHRRPLLDVAIPCTAAVVYWCSDLLENSRTGRIVEAIRADTLTAFDDAAFASLHRWSTAKWLSLAVAALGVVWLTLRPSPQRPRTEWGAPDNRPGALPGEGPDGWDPVPERLGICVSGGGIRSASFGLGALQVLDEHGHLARARYVASASGGSYITSAYALANAARYADKHGDGAQVRDYAPGEPRVWAPGSPEEQRLRRNLRYLASRRAVIVGAVSRILLGLAINVAVVWLVCFAVARPLGWVIGSPSLHPELRVTLPVAQNVTLSRATSCDGVVVPQPPNPAEAPGHGCFGTPVVGGIVQRGVDADAGTLQGEVALLEIDRSLACVKVQLGPHDGSTFAAPVRLVQDAPGLIEVLDGRAVVRSSPTVQLTGPDPGPADWQSCDLAPGRLPAGIVDSLRITRQPIVTVTGDQRFTTVTDPLITPTVTTHAKLSPRSILDRGGDLRFAAWHYYVPISLLAIAVLLFAARITARPNWFRKLNVVIHAAATTGIVVALIVLVLPWLMATVPPWLEHVGNGPRPDRIDLGFFKLRSAGIPPVLGYLLLAGATIRGYLTTRKGLPTREPSGPGRRTKPGARALRTKIGSFIQRYVLGTMLLLLLMVNVVLLLTVAAANGPYGRMAWLTNGTGWLWTVRQHLNELGLWFGACLILLLTRWAEAHSWSLHPIYRRQLYDAFAMRRTSASPHDVVPLHLSKDDQEGPERLTYNNGSGYLMPGPDDGTPGPELVLACTANVLGEGRAPTGRRAVSFTFSRSWTGGPEVGWVETATYLARLGKRRNWDVSIPGIVAISGAAVSPAMGKSTLGPIGSALAMLNVRLGVWIPHPATVNAMTADDAWQHNPGWPWFLRELVRRYRNRSPYLYVTDGGHWDNLALVELLRRGCADVVCISAAGDGELSNATLGEAIEIARSDLGVEISIDQAWSLRPTVGGEEQTTMPSGRQYILDPGTDPVIGRAAPQGVATGTITFPAKHGLAPVVGRLTILEATMIDRLPADVHAYAESHPEFPNVSTGDQFFTDRDFESYRVLGRVVATAAVGLPRFPGP